MPAKTGKKPAKKKRGKTKPVQKTKGRKKRGDLVHNRDGSIHQAETPEDMGCVALSIITAPLEIIQERAIANG